MVSYLVFYKIVQFFIVMALGFILVKSKTVKAGDSILLSKLSLFLLMPSAIIKAFNVKNPTSEIARGLLLAFGMAFLIHFIFLIIDFGYKKLFKAGSVERASVFYSNAANMIIPIVGFALGEEWVIYSSAYLSVQLVYIWTHGVRLFSSGEKFNIKKIIFNVNIIAIAIGVVLLTTGIRPPKLVEEVIDSLGGMLGYVGMLITGMLAAQVDFKKALVNKRLYLTIFMRIVFCAAVVLVALKTVLHFVTIPDAQKIMMVSFLASITPSAATIVQFSQIYNDDVDLAVSINVVSTLFCVLTIPLFVWLYQGL